MPDAVFDHPRLAGVYDPLDGDRRDLHAYLALVDEFDARSVVDIGCGTGTFACLLVERGVDVVGIDPAGASLDVARRKDGGKRVRWLSGTATDLPPLHADLVTMTGDVAQVFLTDEDWLATLRAARSVLRPDGHLVFEVRDPAREAWTEWTREHSYRRVELRGVGPLETWVELTDVTLPYVSFEATFVFEVDGATLTSASSLRFRSHDEIVASLGTGGLDLVETREAPDRPGCEFVFLATPSTGRSR